MTKLIVAFRNFVNAPKNQPGLGKLSPNYNSTNSNSAS